jgi:hypothetical protein
VPVLRAIQVVSLLRASEIPFLVAEGWSSKQRVTKI